MSARSTDRLAALTHRDADWSGLRVVVAGLGVSGFAAADALRQELAAAGWSMLDSKTDYKLEPLKK